MARCPTTAWLLRISLRQPVEAAEDHHDVELMDNSGHRLDKARLHTMIGDQLADTDDAAAVWIALFRRWAAPESTPKQ